MEARKPILYGVLIPEFVYLIVIFVEIVVGTQLGKDSFSGLGAILFAPFALVFALVAVSPMLLFKKLQNKTRLITSLTIIGLLHISLHFTR